MSDAKLDPALLGLAQDAWHRYLELLDPVRPQLFRYCRRLTGNAWDAEDLVQDTLEHGFARLGKTSHGVDNPHAYVLRIASNLWISRQRHERVARANAADAGASPNDAPRPDAQSELRDAGAVLLEQLSPQERAAVLLKETFDLSLEEIADAIGTSVGAVKAALHRGRERLRELDQDTRPKPPRHPVSRTVVDRFVEHYNQRDLPAMLALMLDTAEIDMLNVERQVGRGVWGKEGRWFTHNMYNPFNGQQTTATWQTAVLADQLVVLVLDTRNGQQVITSVMRLETDDDHVSKIRVYAACPDTVREVGAATGHTYGSWGMYRFPKELIAAVRERAAAAAKKAGG